MSAPLPWPLRYIVDEQGRDTGFFAVRGWVHAEARPAFNQLAAARRPIGFTQLGPYPKVNEAPASVGKLGPERHDGRLHRFVQACEGWAHCFRRPDDFLPEASPRVLLGASDFVDPDRVWSLARSEGRVAKRWDLFYSCPPDLSEEAPKNWGLARACLGSLVGDLGLRVLCVGRADVPAKLRVEGIEYGEKLERGEFLASLARSRVAWLPNQLDASPRVLTEALSLDVPLLVNWRILGGWKYVNESTGRFFLDESDVAEQALSCLTARLAPRDWYLENGGPAHAGATLADFLRSLGDGLAPGGRVATAFTGGYAEPSDRLRD